jgi:hypothetical protein
MSPVDELLPASVRELHARLEAGFPIDPNQLDDTEYEGIGLGLPETVERLAWKTFKKVFRRDVRTRVLRGWNVAVEQTGLEGPFTDRLKRGKRATYGHYEVWPGSGYALPGNYHHGLVIDYGRGGNSRFDVTGALRDPLVSLEEGSVTWLLGYSFAQVGPFQVRTPSYFLLRRGKPLTYDVTPPRKTG